VFGDVRVVHSAALARGKDAQERFSAVMPRPEELRGSIELK
jgi:hypothetical protein